MSDLATIDPILKVNDSCGEAWWRLRDEVVTCDDDAYS